MTSRAGAPFCVLVHIDNEPPGLVTTVLDELAVDALEVRPSNGEPFPAVETLAGVVALGGPMGVHDETEHPWLEPERQFLRAAVDTGLVVVGICLGAQQLAAALGADVVTGPAPKLGTGTVTLTEEGRRDPVLGPSGPVLPAVHWHADTFAIPEGAVHLAASDRYANQAFRYGERAYGLQCHLEVDAELAEIWRPIIPGGAVIDEEVRVEVEKVGRDVLARAVTLGW